MDIKQTNGSKGDILIIDDSQDNLSTLDAILKKEGYSVRGAPNGHTGLMIVNTLPPELILLDVKMPGMDGYEVCRKLKADEHTRDIAVIYISALNDLTDIVKGFEAGGVDYITKPFRYKEVLVRVATHLTIQGYQQHLAEEFRNQTTELERANKQLKNEINERKQGEQTLRKSEQKYRSLFENMMQGAFYQQADGVLVDSNPAALEMFGLTRDQFMGRTSMDPKWKIVREDGSDFPGDQHPSMEALRTGKPVHDVIAGVFNPLKKDYTWLSINAIPQFKAGENKPYQVFVTLHNITKLKQAEAELEKHQKHLEERVKERTTELEEKNAELERMNDLFVGREFRIKELRDRIKELELKIQPS